MADVSIDTSHLTYTQFVIPGHSSQFVDGADAPSISLPPGVHGFQQVSGIPANFQFEVTQDGMVDYDTADDLFLDGRGTPRLIVRGFTLTLDARSLSHDLLPMIPGASVLASDRTHQLTLVPASGYGFQPASGIVADFRFDVAADGELVIDPGFAGFARADGRTLIIDGYRITLDGRPLSHDLLPLGMLGSTPVLSRDMANDYTYIPASGYGFQPASGIVADFRFDVAADGELVIDPGFAGFARADGRTLIIDGYRITLDGRGLFHNLVVQMLGHLGVLLRDRPNELSVIPAHGYIVRGDRQPFTEFRFNIDAEGNMFPW
jgi:hypothetical protein